MESGQWNCITAQVDWSLSLIRSQIGFSVGVGNNPNSWNQVNYCERFIAWCKHSVRLIKRLSCVMVSGLRCSCAPKVMRIWNQIRQFWSFQSQHNGFWNGQMNYDKSREKRQIRRCMLSNSRIIDRLTREKVNVRPSQNTMEVPATTTAKHLKLSLRLTWSAC